MRGVQGWIGRLGALGLTALVAACAGVPRDASLPIDDPNEQFNRGVLRVNQVVLDPVANVVKAAPAPVTNRIRDLADNLNEPRIFGNDLLQGRFGAAGIT
ncbi:MAG TPA: MlaA family lipoprotein, partial [Roseiarcus sp.]|nr:MlaA family lipoprotein [Roseiarcus sp.]